MKIKNETSTVMFWVPIENDLLQWSGVEQTAHAAGFTLYLLGVNPAAQDTLYNQLASKQVDNY